MKGRSFLCGWDLGTTKSEPIRLVLLLTVAIILFAGLLVPVSYAQIDPNTPYYPGRGIWIVTSRVPSKAGPDTPLVMTIRSDVERPCRFVVTVAKKERGGFRDITDDALQLSRKEPRVTRMIYPQDCLTCVLFPRVFANNWRLNDSCTYRIRVYRLDDKDRKHLSAQSREFVYRE